MANRRIAYPKSIKSLMVQLVGLKDALENVLNTNRAVTLFEFQRLANVKAGDMKDRVDKYEQAVIAYHKANTKPPALFMKGQRDAKFSKIKRQDSSACYVTYQFFDDYFEIRGKNFDASKLGKDADGLKGHIQHCGALTGWEFTLTPKDPTYEWYAHGKLPIGTKSCVGSAVEASGGTSRGNCHGAG